MLHGGSVNKDSLRIEACGSIDELSSYLGLARSIIKDGKVNAIIESVQKDLFVLSAEMVTKIRFLKKLKKKADNKFIDRLDQAIAYLSDKYDLKLDCFQLPGSGRVSAVLDISRAVTRRAERRVVTLVRKKLINNRCILAYLNRLSDLLYLLARLPKDGLGE